MIRIGTVLLRLQCSKQEATMKWSVRLEVGVLALALAVPFVAVGPVAAYAQTESKERRDERQSGRQESRDIRQEGRHEARSQKAECKSSGDSRSECRQEKRSSKQETRGA